MTRQEFYDKYGQVEVKFISYYKYTFTYGATLSDGSSISCGYGGCSDDIYRYEVVPDYYETINSIQPHMGSVYKDGKEVAEFYDY